MRSALLGGLLMVLPAPAGALDLIYPPAGTGPPLRGEILYLTDEEVRVRALREGVYQGGPTIRTIPLEKVAFIDFEPLPGEPETLDDPAALDLVTLRRLWNALELHLHRPRSNAGAIALAYAERLLEEGTQFGKQDAIPVFDRVRHEDWDSGRRARAQVGRLRALMATGDAATAADEAAVLAEGSEAPEMLIEARYILAEASFVELKRLDEEHPRWVEDDEVRPIREALYHETVDRYLFPYLFHGSREEEAARGLWGALSVHRYGGHLADARSCAQDIARLYAATSYAAPAGAFLAQSPSPDEPQPR